MARILVVDDEPMVGLMIQRTLSPPHEVSVQRTAAGALELFRKGERFDVVLADLNMPGGGGIWLREQLAQVDPPSVRRMLFLTGGAGSAEAQDFLDQPSVRWLEKPFRSAVLLARIEDILRGSS